MMDKYKELIQELRDTANNFYDSPILHRSGYIFEEAAEAIEELLEASLKFAEVWQQSEEMREELQREIEALQHVESVGNTLDCVSRQEAIGGICDYAENMSVEYKVFADAAKRMLLNLPSVNCSEKPNNWIPVSERLPEDLQEVVVTWINREPSSYYAHIKDVPQTGCAVYYGGCWYWYSSCCRDYLAEYGKNEGDRLEDGIVITAWKPLPEPYEWQRKEKE